MNENKYTVEENISEKEKAKESEKPYEPEFDFLALLIVSLAWPIIFAVDLFSWGLKKIRDKK